MTLARIDLLQQIEVTDRGLRFFRALAEAYTWDYETCAAFLEKPWKWTPEFQAWRDCGEPDSGDPAWDEFVERVS